MTPEEKEAFEVLTKKVKTLEDIIYGLSNDPRFVTTIRTAVITGEYVADKPTITNKNGKKYNLQTV